MSAHTSEPWHIVQYGDGDSLVICEDEAGDKRICFMATPGCRDNQRRQQNWKRIKANARRIVAAVNACAGIPTEALESGFVQELVEALRRSRMAWENALDLDLLPTQHQQTARELADNASAALAKIGGA